MRAWRQKNPDKLRAINVRCYQKYHERRKAECRAYHHTNRDTILEKMHGHHIRRKFGIDTEQYNRMLAKQDGVCAICGRPPMKYRLAVDHKHGTEIVRGLLCARCNRGVGLFWDNPAVLRRAAEYLEVTLK